MRSIALLAILGLAACLTEGQSADPPPATYIPGYDAGDALEPEATPEERGAVYYDVYCSLCHGDQGQGYVADHANALSNPLFLAAASDTFLKESITFGRPGTPMSAWGWDQNGPMKENEIDDLVRFLRSWQTLPPASLTAPVEGDIEAGLARFADQCAVCHGDEGAGGRTAMTLNNPWFLHSAEPGFIQHAIVTGRPPTAMPAFAETLTGQQTADLVAAIRSWATPVDEAPVANFEPAIDDPVINPEGDDPALTLREDRYVPSAQVAEALEAGKALVLLDARVAGDYLLGHIRGALSIPFYRIEEAVEALPKDRWIITYCACPHAVSGRAADKLIEAGFEKVAVLDEGYPHWRDAGYPILAGPARQ